MTIQAAPRNNCDALASRLNTQRDLSTCEAIISKSGGDVERLKKLGSPEKCNKNLAIVFLSSILLDVTLIVLFAQGILAMTADGIPQIGITLGGHPG